MKRALITTTMLLCTAAKAMDFAPAAQLVPNPQKAAADAELDRLLAEQQTRRYETVIERLYQLRLISLLELIRKGAHTDITYPETKGCTALHYACDLSHAGLVQWLVNHGANTLAVSDRGASVDDCVGGPEAKEIRKILRDARRQHEALPPSEPMQDAQAAGRAAEQLQTALNCAYVDSLSYNIPEKDASVAALAALLHRYVRTTRSLPPGVEPRSLCGSMLSSIIGSNMSEAYFAALAEKEVRERRSAALAQRLEQQAYFAELLHTLELDGSERSIHISFDRSGQAAPHIRIERSGAPAQAEPQRVLLHFAGYVASPGKGNTRATLHYMPNLHWVSICNDTTAESIAHYTGHSAHVRYNSDRLQLLYTPEGKLAPESPTPPHNGGISVYFGIQE